MHRLYSLLFIGHLWLGWVIQIICTSENILPLPLTIMRLRLATQATNSSLCGPVTFMFITCQLHWFFWHFGCYKIKYLTCSTFIPLCDIPIVQIETIINRWKAWFVMILLSIMKQWTGLYAHSLLCVSIYIYSISFNKSCINQGTRKATRNVLTHTSIRSGLSFSVYRALAYWSHSVRATISFKKINTDHRSMDMHQLINQKLLNVLFIN